MTTLREAAQQALEALEMHVPQYLKDRGYPPITALKAALAEPDLFHCPKCGGPADNGHDRSIPPSPYWCTKCMAEPVRKPLTEEEIARLVTNDMVKFARAVERAHGITP